MLRRQFLRLASGGALTALGLGMMGCVAADDYPPRRYRPYPDTYYDYYYYPSVNVYFHEVSGYYYFYDGGRWRRSRSLPYYYRLDPRYRRRLRIRDSEPWRHNDRHRREYGGREFRDWDRDRRWDRDRDRRIESDRDRDRRKEGDRDRDRDRDRRIEGDRDRSRDRSRDQERSRDSDRDRDRKWERDEDQERERDRRGWMEGDEPRRRWPDSE